MTLSAGARLGPYVILSSLGTGGMGEVYRSKDTRLERSVAIKVLSDEIAGDPRALARFRTEAKAVAALSHPNIMAIHDVGEAGGVHFAVMELLEGETLRALVGRGPLPVRRALEIACQLADALAAAHEKGIIHRDVKPENAFITTHGRAKLLDFGLSRRSATFSGPCDSLASTTPALTEAGAVLGTVAYMSPEQAEGLSVDHRSDQFSLGIVLYEMLTGRQPFRGASVAETLVAILREEPERIEVTAPQVPAPVRWLVVRLLSKDRGERYDSTRDLARELRTWSQNSSEADIANRPTRTGGEGTRWWTLPSVRSLSILAAGVLTGTLVTSLVTGRTRLPSSSATRMEIRLPEGHYFSRFQQPFAISPDGKLLVFSAFEWKRPFEEEDEPRLFLRSLDSFEARPIPGTEGGIQPVFSPDGRQVAFTVVSQTGASLKRAPVEGGQASTICQCQALFGIAWPPGGSILFGTAVGPLQRVLDTGGTPEAATSLDAGEGEVSHRLPHLLPDGRTVLYTALRWTVVGMTWERSRIFAQRLGSHERHLLAEGGSDARYVPPGDLLFAREGRLFVAPLDAKDLRLTGRPVSILEGVSHTIFTGWGPREIGAAMVDLSGARVFAWIPGSVSPEPQSSFVWVDASGKATPVDLPSGPYLGGRVSPDGKRLLVQNNYPGRQAELLELSRGTRRNVTFEMNPRWAIWGPGPDRITFVSDHEGPLRIYSRRIDAGPEEVETLWKGQSWSRLGLGSWSRDGKTLAFVVVDEKTGYDIWLLEAGGAARPIVASGFQETHPDISPDGRWLVYGSTEPGRSEVFVRPLSGPGAPRQVSVEGGLSPLWSRDGSAIFYWADLQTSKRSALFRVSVKTTNEGLSFGLPERLFEGSYLQAWPNHAWDIAPDGRFLLLEPPKPADRRNWLDKVVADRIRIDIDGLPALVAEAGKKP